MGKSFTSPSRVPGDIGLAISNRPVSGLSFVWQLRSNSSLPHSARYSRSKKKRLSLMTNTAVSIRRSDV
jgi:hypothetical protein